MLRKGIVCLCALMCAAALGGVSAMAEDPPNKVMIVFHAYTGLTFNSMFPETGVTFPEYELMLKANLEMLRDKASTPEVDKAWIIDILADFERLEQEIKNTPDIAKERLHAFFAADLSSKYPALFEILYAIENKGFTISFLSVPGSATGCAGFLALLAEARFLTSFGNMCYSDFYRIPKDDPIVTEEMIRWVDAMHKAGMFGTIPVRLVDAGENSQDQTELTRENIGEIVQMKGNNMCCNTSRKCVAFTGYNCPVCNQTTQACCLGAQSCPPTF